MGKARSFSDADSEAVYQTETNNENYVLGSQQNAQGLGNGVFNDQSGYGNFSQSGSDQSKASLDGALFRGNIGHILQSAFLDFDTNTIELLVDQSNDPVSKASTDRSVIISGFNTTADLITILGAQRPGQRLFLYNTFGNTITIKNTAAATENTIVTPDAGDLVLSGNSVVELVFDDILEKWRVAGNVGGGGTGTGTPPFEYGLTLITATSGNVILDLKPNSNAKGQHFIFTNELTGDVDITFSNTPPDGFSKPYIIEYSLGASVFNVTFNDPTDVTPIAGTANATTKLAGYITNNAGIIVSIFTMTSTAGTGGAAFSGNLSDLVINVNKNWASQGISNFGSLTGVTGIDMDGATATIQGVQLLELFQTDQQIESLSTGIEYSVGDLQSHLFKSQTNNIAQFEESAANVFKLDMLDHAIKDAKDISFDVNASFSGSGAVPTIGYDNSGTDNLFYNVPTLAGHQWTVNNVSIMRVTNASMTFGVNFQILCAPDTSGVSGLNVGGIAGDVIAPVNGDIHYNTSTNTFRFRQNGGYVEIGGGGANTELSNLDVPTLINTSLISDTADTDDLGSELIPWRIAHVRQLQFDATSSSPTGSSDTQISRTAALSMEFNAAGAGVYNWFFAGTNVWTLSSTLLSASAAGILIDRSLTFNSSGTDPAGDGELTRNTTNMLLQTPEFTVQNVTTTGSDVAELTLLKIDTGSSAADNVADINFSVDDSGITQYARIRSTIIDQNDAGSLNFAVRADGVNNITAITIQGSPSTSSRTFVELNSSSRIGSDLAFQVPTGSTSLKIFPALNQLGIVVQDNVSFTVGTNGTIAIPIVNTIPANASGADTAFGNHNGAIGLFDNETDDMAFFIRQLDGNWSALFVTTYDFLT